MNINEISACKLNFNVMSHEEETDLVNSFNRRLRTKKLEAFKDKIIIAPITDENKDLAKDLAVNPNAKYLVVDGHKRVMVWVHHFPHFKGEIPDSFFDIRKMNRREIKQYIWEANIRGHKDIILLSEFIYDDLKNGLKQIQIADKYGISRQMIEKLIRIASDLSTDIKKDYICSVPSKITKSDLDELVRLKDRKLQKKVYTKIKSEEHTVQETRRLVKEYKKDRQKIMPEYTKPTIEKEEIIIEKLVNDIEKIEETDVFVMTYFRIKDKLFNKFNQTYGRRKRFPNKDSAIENAIRLHLKENENNDRQK